jgi:predicted nucleic acid-binding Zn finger protein
METTNLQNGKSMARVKAPLDANLLIKGIKLALEGRVKPYTNGKRGYIVSGDTDSYFVPESFDSCTCPFWQKHKETCKHMIAVRVYRRLELKTAEIRAEISAQYESQIKELEAKLRNVAEENLKLRTELEGFSLLREGIKKIISTSS